MFGMRQYVPDRASAAFTDPARTIAAGSGLWPKIERDVLHPDAALAGLSLWIRSRMVRNG